MLLRIDKETKTVVMQMLSLVLAQITNTERRKNGKGKKDQIHLQKKY